MPTAHDIQQHARELWMRSFALSSMFQRHSLRVGRWSTRLSFSSIGLGLATGLVGLSAGAQEPSAVLGYGTGILGLLTGATNTLREQFWNPDRESKLWTFRNDAASLQEKIALIFVEASDPEAHIENLDNALHGLADQLQSAETTPHANRVENRDREDAAREFAGNARLVSAALIRISDEPKTEEQLEDSPSTRGMIPMQRGISR